MSARVDRLARSCAILADEFPEARRCLSAMRRSGRDVDFNAHLAIRRMGIDLAKPARVILRWITAIIPDTN